jgi:hypothetical protein
MFALLGKKPDAIAAPVALRRAMQARLALPLRGWGNISMTSAGRAPSPASLFESLMTQPGASRRPAPRSVPAFAQKLIALSVMSCAMALAGCANKSATPGYEANSIHATEPADRQPQLRIRRPDRALLKPQPAPDCEFRESGIKPVDPDQWARLKLDYERQCYQRAEQATRKRLRLLQASSTCELEPVHHSSPAVR